MLVNYLDKLSSDVTYFSEMLITHVTIHNISVKFFLVTRLEKWITFTEGLAGKKNNNREGF